MAKKKGKGKKKKKSKGPKRDPKITVAEYLLDCGTQKKLRLMDNAKYWEDDNQELQNQVGILRSELEVSIAYLRRREGSERRLCEEEVAAREGELSEAEAQLQQERSRHERAEFELSEELREVMLEVADTEEQVNFWKNYPFNQNLEKREKIKCLKSAIQQIDELHDAFEAQLDGNFRYMQQHLVSDHVHRLERAKRTAAGWALRHVSLSDHSDLVAQPLLCLQSVINQQRGDTLRDRLDWIDDQNSSLQRSLVPLRRLEIPPQGSTPSASVNSLPCPEPSGAETGDSRPLQLHVESITHLLTAARPSSAERALVDRVRDATLQQLRPDEDEQRARALARLVRPAASELGGSVGSPAESVSGSDASGLSADQLLPFETPIQVRAEVRRQAPRPFESWVRQRRWWRVAAPRPRARRWPVTGPHIALYVDQPPVFDLAGPKVINESPSVSSAHISDEWELGKSGWQDHLRRRSPLSAGSSPVSQSTGSESSGGGRTSDGTADTRGGSSKGATIRGGSSIATTDGEEGSGGKLNKNSSSRSEETKSSKSTRAKKKTSKSSGSSGSLSSSKNITKVTSSKAITGAA